MGFRKKLDIFLERTLAIIFAVMVINVLWQVFSRYLLGNPSSFTDELARYLLVWLGILGAAYVSGKSKHVAIDILPARCNKKVQKNMRLAVHVLIILFCLLALIIGGGRLVYLTFVLEQYSPSLRLPLALVYAILPLSGSLIVYYKISDILQK